MSTIQHFFEAEKLTKEIIETVSEESPYWEGASKFIIENWERPVGSLTPRQERWMDKILEDLTERRIARGFRRG